MSTSIDIQHQQELEALKQYAKMETREDIDNFESTIWLLIKDKNEVVLPQLFQIFDDECPYPEVMWTLLHAVESYDDDEYVKALLLNIDQLARALEWQTRLFYRIINNFKCLKILENSMHIADRKMLGEIFDKIYEESEEHRLVIEELKTKLNNQN